MKEQIRLLMVEDTTSDAELIVRSLARANLDCAVLRVDTEAGFVNGLRDHRPEVILSDFSMPQFDGLRALEIAVEQARDVPFIFVSGTIGEERAIDALRRGATDYVLKGNLKRLAAAIERALAESALKVARRQAEQQLRDNEQRLRDTVETSQDWIWELDERGRFRFCSNAVANILGYEPGALIGRNYRELLCEDEESPQGRALLPQAGATLTGAVARWRAADGQSRWLERNAVTILDERGQPVGYRGADRDITARREQEARLQRLTRSYRMLSSTGSAILRLAERGELLQEICRIAVQQGGYERVLIALRQPTDDFSRPLTRAGGDSAVLRSFDRALLASESPSGNADAPLIDNDLAVEAATVEPSQASVLRALSASERRLLVAQGYHALAALPVKVDGTVVGSLLLFSVQAGVFDQIELQVLQELAANLGFALQYQQRDEALQFLSYYDSLTGLAKRGLFCQRLDHWLRSQTQSPAVVLFDVQQLSAINDSYGRYVGDALIGAIAARLRDAYGTDNTAYLGGGTFGLLRVIGGEEGNGGSTGASLHQAIMRLLADPFRIEGQELRPAVRVGVAQHPQDAKTADALVQNGEAALKSAREDNERYVPFAQIRQRRDTRSLALEGRLASALARDEFLLHYQPKVHLQSGLVVGLEALLRWQDAQEGVISPAVFVPLLERSGAIGEVGEWVIQQAVRDAAVWEASGVAPVRIAVNVSPLQLRRRDFVERVLASVRGGSRQAPGIDVEITESMLMQDLELSIRKLKELAAEGIGVAIDDFGTGYSSLRLLSRLPVDTLKIDRSFIQAMSEGATNTLLVSTIVSLATAFGMKVVAEGVETQEQARELRRMRCEQAQGYLFCRPVPAVHIPGIIERLNRTAPDSQGVPANPER